MQAPWLLMIETDYVWMKPLQAPPAEDASAASLGFPFGYIIPQEPSIEGVMRKMYPAEKGPLSDVPGSGPAPVLMRVHEWIKVLLCLRRHCHAFAKHVSHCHIVVIVVVSSHITARVVVTVTLSYHPALVLSACYVSYVHMGSWMLMLSVPGALGFPFLCWLSFRARCTTPQPPLCWCWQRAVGSAGLHFDSSDTVPRPVCACDFKFFIMHGKISVAHAPIVDPIYLTVQSTSSLGLREFWNFESLDLSETC